MTAGAGERTVGIERAAYYAMLAFVALLPFSILIAAVVVWRHRSNLRRLYQGEEERFRDKLS